MLVVPTEGNGGSDKSISHGGSDKTLEYRQLLRPGKIQTTIGCRCCVNYSDLFYVIEKILPASFEFIYNLNFAGYCRRY